MRNVQDLIKNSEEYKKATIQEKLKSKKNTVAYVTIKDKPRILKLFVPGLKNNMKNEYSVLKKGSSKLNMPTPFDLDEKNNVIVLNYIIGENLCDIINDGKTTTTEKERLMILLAEWFKKFHEHFKDGDNYYIRGDSNLRNFIFNDRIWGVDFEEARVGKPIEDIAGMCSSILSTDPMFTAEKFRLCKKFIESYRKNTPWVVNDINSEVAYALLEKIQYRPGQEEILRKYSNKIRQKGII